MRREEFESARRCAVCGAPVRSTDVAFAFDADRDLLCGECAIGRGGQYDAEHGRWTVAPEVADLLRSGG